MIFTAMKMKRILKGLTQEEASLKLGISQSYLSQIENYSISPDYRVLNKMTKLYKCEMKDLFPETS